MRGGQDTKCWTEFDPDFPVSDFKLDECEKNDEGKVYDVASLDVIPDQDLVKLVCKINNKSHSKCYDIDTLYGLVLADIKSKFPETPEELQKVQEDIARIDNMYGSNPTPEQKQDIESRINDYMFRRGVERAPQNAKEPTTRYKFTPEQKAGIVAIKWIKAGDINKIIPELEIVPLTVAIVMKADSIVKKLLADPNKKEPILMAIITGNDNILKEFLKHPRIDVNRV